MNLWKAALFSALVLTGLWLLSPSRSTKAPENGVLEITFMGGGPISGAMDDAVREFEKQTRQAHAKDPSKPAYRVVSGQNASRDQTADPTRFLVSVAGGMPPDVIYFDRFAVSEWAARKAFTPLDDFLARDLAAHHPDAIQDGDYFPPCWDETVYKNPVTGEQHVYGIPNSVDNRALFYNKDLMKRAGFVDSKGEARPPKTWDELEEMAVKLTEKDQERQATRMGFVPNWGNSFLYIYGWLNGGEFMSADGRRCTLNDPRIVEALTWMTKIYDALGGAKQVYAFQSTFQEGDLDPFLTGKIAIKIDTFGSVIYHLAQFGRNLNYGIAPPPVSSKVAATGLKTVSWLGGWCYAIPSTAKNKEGAWALIRFLSSRRAIEIIAESDRLQTESQGHVYVPTQNPNRKFNEWLFDKYIYHNPSMDPKIGEAVKVFNDLLPEARYRPVTPVGQLLWNQHIDAMENAVFHKMTPQEALDRGTMTVQRELDRALQPPRGTVVKWGFFFWLYGAILVAAAVLIYYWDTHRGFRQTLGAWLDIFGGGLKTHGGESKAKTSLGSELEGLQTPYFRSQWKGGWLCALPWIVGFICFTGGPILFSIIISFCDYDIMNPARFIGWANYHWMFTHDPLFWKSLKNTLFMVAGIPLGMSLGLGIALLLNQKVGGVAVWRTFFYLPSIVPAVASSILWIWIFNPSGGLLNNVLSSFGIHGPNWLQDENTSKPALILMGLWGAGGGMVIWLAGLKSISESYYEAASLDGANAWRQFTSITLPLLSPYIFFNLVMALIGTFQIFTEAFIMTAGGPVNSTLFYSYYLFNNAFRYLHMGYAASMAWVLFMIVFALTMAQMRLSRKWVHYEGD